MLLVSGIVLGITFGIQWFVAKKLLKSTPGFFLKALISLAFLIGAFIAQLFVTDLLIGIGPDIAKGKIPAPSAIKYSLMSAAIAMYTSWTLLRPRP